MVGTILMVLAIIFLPWAMIWLTKVNKFCNTLGTVFLCYIFGLGFSFLFKALGANLGLAETVSSVFVIIAMPLILLSSDFKSLKKLAKPMAISYSFDVIAIIIFAFLAFYIFNDKFENGVAAKISAMCIGIFTGGTPNLIATGHALNAGDYTMLSQTAEMITGGIYFFFLLSFLPGLMSKFLGKYKPVGIKGNNDDEIMQRIASKGSAGNYVKIVLLGVACLAVGAGVAMLFPSKYGNGAFGKISEYQAVVMLIVTTLGILLSFVPKVRNIPGSYQTGQYLIYMFSVAMGLCFDLGKLAGAMMIFVMVLFIQFTAILFHMLLAKLGHIDGDTMLITSTAGIFGPAFIIPVANAMKNDEIILPGMLCGILGYAIGNYLGVGFGEIMLHLCGG